MRIGVLVDSACDLPKSFIDEQGIVLMPIAVRIGDDLIEDKRDPIETLKFYQTRLDRKSDNFAESIPYSVQQIEELFFKRLIFDFDYVYCLTITAQRSPIYDHMSKASVAVISDAPYVRRDAGLPEDFGMSIISSQNIFTGQAVQAAEAMRLIHDTRKHAAPSEIDFRLRMMGGVIHAYLLPADLFHIYRRASKRGEKSVGWGSYMVGSMLDVLPILHCHADTSVPVAKVLGFESGAKRLFAHTIVQMRKGLRTPYVCVSYGGPLGKLREMPGFDDLRQAAAECHVTVLTSLMSTTAAVNVGPGALSVGFAVSDPAQSISF